MTITTALILLIVTIIGVGVALAGVLVPANNRHSRDIAELRQQVNQLAQQVNQQINQLTQQVGHLSGVVEGLRVRPIVTEQPEENRV